MYFKNVCYRNKHNSHSVCVCVCVCVINDLKVLYDKTKNEVISA